MNDIVIGRVFRALRHARSWRQEDVGHRAGVSQDAVSEAELGRVDAMSLRRLRNIAQALEADLVVTVRWRGGDLDRLLDEGHATLIGLVIQWLEALGWELRPEVTFSVYGERGSIDLLAWHAPTRTLLVIEIKTELTSVEETLRRHDVKTRLASRIAADQFGWHALNVSRLLVLPATSTARRRVRRHDEVLGRAYPLRAAPLRQWLRSPSGAGSGLEFVSLSHEARGSRRPLARKRIRRANG